MNEVFKTYNEENPIHHTVPQFEFTYKGEEYSAWGQSFEGKIEDITIEDNFGNDVTFEFMDDHKNPIYIYGMVEDKLSKIVNDINLLSYNY
jgi:hypothetical protein